MNQLMHSNMKILMTIIATFRAYLVMKMSKIMIVMTNIVGFIVSFIVPLMKQNTLDFILFGLPWSIVFVSACHSCCSTIWFHATYFHLTCFHLTIIMKQMNARLTKRMSIKSLKRKLTKLNDTLSMIYDRSNASRFWSQVVLSMALGLTGVVILNAYQALFNNSQAILTIAYAQLMLLTFICISVFILSASLLNAEIIKSYLLLIRINTKYQLQNITVKLKVRVIL
jgi:hypothetical protein